MTGPRTAGQSVAVMAASVGHQVAQRENPRDERDARVGRQAGGDGRVTVSGVDSVQVRVHLYERRFPAKPVSRVHVRRKQQRHRTRHARRTRRCHGSSAVLPDDGDTHPGRERPPRIEARDRVRGVAEGVAHAPDISALLLTAALTATRAAQSAARCSAAKSHTAKNIAESTRLATTLTQPSALEANSRQGGGTLLPSLCSPLVQDIHTQVAYTRWSGVHRGPRVYSDGRGLPGGR